METDASIGMGWLLLSGPLALVLAALLGGLQYGLYRLLRVPSERSPIFPVLLLRGMLMVMAGIAVTAISIKFGGDGVKAWEDPQLTPEQQEQWRQTLDPAVQEERRRQAELKRESETVGGAETALPPSP